MDDQRLNDIPDVPMKGALPCVRCHMLVARYAPQVLASTGTYTASASRPGTSAGTASGPPCWPAPTAIGIASRFARAPPCRNAPPEPIVTRRRARHARPALWPHVTDAALPGRGQRGLAYRGFRETLAQD